jgi:small ligand-binding sensory domain FIST
MTRAITPAKTRSAKPSTSPAIARCCAAWERAFQAELAKGEDEIFARVTAHEAYRDAMPTLSAGQSVGEYIACVAQGILIGAIQEKRGSKLLYAAQIVLINPRCNDKKEPKREAK